MPARTTPHRSYGLTSGRKPACASVIAVADEDSPALRHALATLARQVKEEGAELILIFSSWPDDLAEPSRRALMPLVDLLLFEPRPGRAVALNTAVHAALTDVIAIVGVHSHIAGSWLPALLTPLWQDPELAGVGGPVETVFPGGEVPRWYRPLSQDPVASFLLPVHHMGPVAREYASPAPGALAAVPLGSNCAWRREWLLRFPFDESLPDGSSVGAEAGDGEDVLLGHRVLEAGGRIAYAPRAVVYRPTPASEIGEGSALAWSQVRGQKYARVMDAMGEGSTAPTDRLKAQSTSPWRSRLRKKTTREYAAHVSSFAEGTALGRSGD